jgi:hypothetical protein
MVLGCGEYVIPNCEHNDTLSEATDKIVSHHPIVFMIFCGAKRPLVPAAANGSCTGERYGGAAGGAVAPSLSFPLLDF